MHSKTREKFQTSSGIVVGDCNPWVASVISVPICHCPLYPEFTITTYCYWPLMMYSGFMVPTSLLEKIGVCFLCYANFFISWNDDLQEYEQGMKNIPPFNADLAFSFSHPP